MAFDNVTVPSHLQKYISPMGYSLVATMVNAEPTNAGFCNALYRAYEKGYITGSTMGEIVVGYLTSELAYHTERRLVAQAAKASARVRELIEG